VRANRKTHSVQPLGPTAPPVKNTPQSVPRNVERLRRTIIVATGLILVAVAVVALLLGR